MLTRLIDWSLHHRWAVLALTLALVVSGLLSFRALPLDAFPDTTPPQVQVNTVAPTLSPLEVAYWDGAAFTALTAVDNDLADGTNVLKNSGEISFTPPSGWATTAVNGVTKYYIRLKLGTANPGTAPVGTTVKLGTLGAPLVTAYADSDVIAPSVPVSGAWATNALRGPRNFPGGTVLKAKNNAGDVVTAWVGGTDYA